VTIHNLHFFSTFMAAIREAIAAGTLNAGANAWLGAIYQGGEDDTDEDKDQAPSTKPA
jgi:queuine/archaeosine tRNA-ribosyltransferase